MSASLAERVRARALELGFDAVGFAAADAPLDSDFERYRAFVAEGLHGEMRFLVDDAEVRARLDGGAILAGAKSVVCVAETCGGALDERDAEGLAPHVARYARGQDYHNHLRKRLRKLAAFLRELGPGVEARPMCDDVPVLERAWAARAGLGFVGKNGMLISPGLGSHVLLGEVVTTLELPAATPIAERCGACTLCLDACPTEAFVRPFVLDARRCVSYLTIELRGEMPPEHRAAVGEHLFGCDACQDVCPFNAGAAARAPRKARYAPLARWASLSVAALAAMDGDALAATLVGSPLHRATPAGLVRDALTVLANRANGEDRALVARLAEAHDDAAVRAHARAALGAIDARAARGERT